MSFFLFASVYAHATEQNSISFNFYGEQLSLPYSTTDFVDYKGKLDNEAIHRFCEEMATGNYQPLIKALQEYKTTHKPDDWLYYQLIRNTAQAISPKAADYNRYTLYKWYFMMASGYDATLCITNDKVLFYVQSNDNIYDVPFRMVEGKQYICLNYHDYGSNLEALKDSFTDVNTHLLTATNSFSYKVTQLPDFKPSDYQEKDIVFNYNQTEYKFKIKLNTEVKKIFANYPVTDYEAYFNLPLSKETYNSLIPALKESVRGMGAKTGVDYLMNFTRHAFLYQPDKQSFGKEKRLSAEQTLLSEYSDCEDRAALFFYLVKEIYNMPMIVLAFPEHVTVAVKFDKPIGRPIIYNGSTYTVCEPTPQRQDLRVGQLSRELSKETYEVAYVYNP